LGFSIPVDQIKGICAERKISLIEDCAHALLSTHNGKPLGSYGDVSTFSLLKSLPVPNGGILLINNSNVEYNHYPKNPNLFVTSFYAAELLRRRTVGNNNPIKENALNLLYGGVYLSMSSARLMLAGFRKYFNPQGLYLVKPDSYLFIEVLREWGISDLSKRIINKTNFEEVKIIRRKNFEYLLNHFLKNGRGTLPFNELPPGVCPVFSPIIIENPKKRDSMYRILKSKGVVTHPWWERFHQEVLWNDFPDAVYLKQRLFGLPIHQDLTFGHIDRIIEEFEKAYKSV